MKKLIGIFALTLFVCCQKAELIESDKNTRSEAEQKDSVDVDIEIETEGWEGSTNAEFGFG